MNPNRQRWLWGADVLWTFALLVYVLLGAPLVPFHGDESTLIMMSRDYDYQFLQRDLDQVLFHDPPLNATEQHLRLLNGTVTKYLIGLSWHLAGYTADDLNDQWDWGADWDWNVAHNHKPTDDLLLVARWHAALLTALSVLLIFALARRWAGRWAAYPASFLLATHPVLLLNGRRAIMDAPLLFFGLLTVLLAARWGIWISNRQGAKSARKKPVIFGVLAVPVLLGLAAGLTIAGKHSGAVLVVAVYLALLITIFWRVREGWARHLSLLILSGLVALGVFLLLNPAWWGGPIERAGEVLRLRAELVAGQSAAFPEAVYPDFGARLGGLLYQLTTAPPAYYEVPAWADYIAEPIRAYESSPWTGLQYGANGLTSLLGIGVFLLALPGAGRLVRDLRAGNVTALVVGLWAALTILFILATVPLTWQRYIMPLYPVEALLAGAGFSWLGSRMRSRLLPESE